MSSSSPRGGIVSTAGHADAAWLPLESLNAHVYIADITARVVLSQVYSNPSLGILREAYYVFPVPARAAVCSFEMRTNDGRRLKGIVKEVSQAKAEYEEALSEGRLAGLLEQFRQDVFVVLIGTIPQDISVTVAISYVMDLPEDDEPDTVRFQLASHVGARYGASPTSILYHGTAHKARLSIMVDVEMSAPISDVFSPTHMLQDMARSPPGPPSFVHKQFISREEFLDRDFLLIVQAPGLDQPRCLAESLSSTISTGLSNPSRRAPTTALALTIVPRFHLPALPSQEYIFLIDRSGSMTGSSIFTAKKALALLLGMLPSNETTFNIFSFGSRCSSLWHRCQQYNQVTLQEARNHAHSLKADMGGTELFGALSNIFSTRSKTRPTSVFVLTDGEIYSPEKTIDLVSQAVSSTPTSAPLRLFTLGVGHGASTALCEGIARAGDGACSMALEVENLMLKAARLVNVMRVATVNQVTVDWGVPCQVEAPHPIPTLSPGLRILVTAILDLPREQTPTQVTLRGSLSDGRTLEYEVPVTPLTYHSPSRLLDAAGMCMTPPPLIHTLAAHRFIRSLENGESRAHELPNLSGLTPATRSDVMRNLIVDVGTRYQVASSRTAFVAVDAPHRIKSPVTRGSSGKQASRDGTQRGTMHDDPVDDTSSRRDSPKASSRSQNGRGEEGRPDTGWKSVPSSNSSPISRKGSNGSKPSAAGSESTASQTAGRGFNAQANGESHAASHTSKGGQMTSNSPKGGSRSSHMPEAGSEVLRANGAGSSNERPNGHGPPPGSLKTSPSSRRGTEVSQALESGNLGLGAALDFFAHEPPQEPPGEVVCFPDPSGGIRRIIFMAPPLPHIPVFTSFRRSILSRLFRPSRDAQQSGMATSEAKRPLFRFSRSLVPADPVDSTNEISNIACLQDFDGSFSLSSLPAIVGISEPLLRFSIPSELISVNAGGDRVWATAIAIAFLRKRFPRHSEVWECLRDKALEFGSLACGGAGLTFEQIVQQATGELSARVAP